MLDKIKSKIHDFVKSETGGKLLRWGFANHADRLPLDRVCEDDQVVAFHHPRPDYPVHILIVPKQAVPALSDVDPQSVLPGAVFHAAQMVVAELGLDQHGYRLIVNGGTYQEVQQLHFHLISDQPALSKSDEL
jgi:histidine triad (HIT) family protein